MCINQIIDNSLITSAKSLSIVTISTIIIEYFKEAAVFIQVKVNTLRKYKRILVRGRNND